MKIIKADINDLKDLLLLQEECFIDPWKEEDLKYELLNNPVNQFYVCKQENKIIGFINFIITFNSSSIVQIGVLKQYRKQGVAQILFDHMLSELSKFKDDDVIETITIEVRVGNDSANNFYKKNGFELVVVKKNYYVNGEDANYYVRRLI